MKNFIICIVEGIVFATIIGANVFMSTKDINLTAASFSFCVFLGLVGGMVALAASNNQRPD